MPHVPWGKAFHGTTLSVLKFSDPSPWLAAGAFEQTNVRSRPPSKPQTSSTRTVRSRARRPLASARLPGHDRCKSQPSGTVAQEPGAPLIKPSTATINTRAIAAKKSSAESAPTAKARPLHPAGALFLLLPLVLFGDASSVFYLFNGREQMLKSRWRGGGRCVHGASTTEAARPLLWSIRRCAFFCPGATTTSARPPSPR